MVSIRAISNMGRLSNNSGGLIFLRIAGLKGRNSIRTLISMEMELSKRPPSSINRYVQSFVVSAGRS